LPKAGITISCRFTLSLGNADYLPPMTSGETGYGQPDYESHNGVTHFLSHSIGEHVNHGL
jgi:hypothetical protein